MATARSNGVSERAWPIVGLEPEPLAAGAHGGDIPLTALDAPVPESPTRSRRGPLLRRALMTADLAALGTVLAATATLVGGHASSAGVAGLAGLALVAWLILASAHELYDIEGWRSDYGAAEELGRTIQITTLWVWTVLGLAWLTDLLDSVRLGAALAAWALAVVLIIGLRAVARSWCRRRVSYWQNVLVIGALADATPVTRRIIRNSRFGMNVVACVDATRRSRFEPGHRRYVDFVPVIGSSPSVLEVVRTLGIDRVILAGSVDPDYERELVPALVDLGVCIDFVPSWSEQLGARLDVHSIAGVPTYTLPRAELSRSAERAKRVMDVLVSATALIAISPMLAVCALAIKLTSAGPVFFRQPRMGRDDIRFEVIKFRSMYVDAEQRKSDVAALSFHGGGTREGMFKIRRDPRITPVGRIMRRYSLDELPQLINVLLGDMSLVGPRPLIENEHRQIEGRWRRRVSLTPGLTGLWQVHGRSDIPFDEMVRLDCLYASSWSLRGDLKLLLRTVSAVLSGRGAY
jgi:exopolysaccharide biosynthesis polyprenyl glycosylphosphotransferase